MERSKGLYLSLVKKFTLCKSVLAMSSVNLAPLLFPNCRERTTTKCVSLFVLPISISKSAKISLPLRLSISAVYVPNPYGKFPGCFCPLIIPTVIYVQAAHTVKKFILILFKEIRLFFTRGQPQKYYFSTLYNK
jgi:hypothetical protein